MNSTISSALESKSDVEASYTAIRLYFILLLLLFSKKFGTPAVIPASLAGVTFNILDYIVV